MSGRKRLKKRYIAAIVIILISVATTPIFVHQARVYRISVGIEPKAPGGEYLVIPLGITVACSVIDISKEVEKKREKRRREKENELQNYRT